MALPQENGVTTAACNELSAQKYSKNEIFQNLAEPERESTRARPRLVDSRSGFKAYYKIAKKYAGDANSSSYASAVLTPPADSTTNGGKSMEEGLPARRVAASLTVAGSS